MCVCGSSHSRSTRSKTTADPSIGLGMPVLLISKGTIAEKYREKRRTKIAAFSHKIECFCGFDQEDVNGEKLTVKKWWIFGADLFHGLAPIFSRFGADFSRFVRGINGDRWSFSWLVFHGLPPLDSKSQHFQDAKSATNPTQLTNKKLQKSISSEKGRPGREPERRHLPNTFRPEVSTEAGNAQK